MSISSTRVQLALLTLGSLLAVALAGGFVGWGP